MPGGRPSKLTPEVREKIVDYVATGLLFQEAAQAVGIHPGTLSLWKKKGEEAFQEIERREAMTKKQLQQECRREGVSPSGTKAQIIERLTAEVQGYYEFFEALKKAEAAREVYWLGLIQKAGTGHDGDWKAIAWLLERTNPKRFARRTITELVGKDDGPVEVAGADSIRDRIKRALEDIQERKDQAPDLKVIDGGQG